MRRHKQLYRGIGTDDRADIASVENRAGLAAGGLAGEVALLLLIDPIVSPIWAWWVHHEVPGSWALAGGAVVLLVTALKTWLDARGPLSPRSFE